MRASVSGLPALIQTAERSNPRPTDCESARRHRPGRLPATEVSQGVARTALMATCGSGSCHVSCHAGRRRRGHVGRAARMADRRFGADSEGRLVCAAARRRRDRGRRPIPGTACCLWGRLVRGLPGGSSPGRSGNERLTAEDVIRTRTGVSGVFVSPRWVSWRRSTSIGPATGGCGCRATSTAHASAAARICWANRSTGQHAGPPARQPRPYSPRAMTGIHEREGPAHRPGAVRPPRTRDARRRRRSVRRAT